jgi:hypothetical protein
MRGARPSWWLCLIAAAFVTQFVFLTYVVTAGPAPVGIQPDFDSARMILRSVDPGSAAERAGLRAGDVVTSFAGIEVHSAGDWAMARGQVALGRPAEVTYERGGERLSTSLVQQQRRWSVLALPQRVSVIVFRTALLGYLVLAIFIAFNRPDDARALIGAAFLGCLQDATVTQPTGLFALIRVLPSPVAALVWVAWSAGLVAPGLITTFFLIFPRPLLRPKQVLASVWIVGAVAYVVLISVCLAEAYRPEALRHGLPSQFLPLFASAALIYVAGGLAAGIVNYRRLTDAAERRRVRLIVTGAVVSWGSMVLVFLPPQIVPSFRLVQIADSVPVQIAASMLAIVFPVTFAYAILRHRVFDVGLLIRQGLQYAAARRVLLGLVPLLTAVLVLDIVLHRQQSLPELFAARGWVYVLIGALAYVAHWRQKPWLEALDRRYFRERYDANALLRQTVEELRRATSIENAAPVVVRNIESALHPKFVAWVVREAEEKAYHALATAPAGAIAPRLMVDNKIVALLRVLATPLAVSESQSAWIRQQLPPEDSSFLTQARIDLLVPVVVGERSARESLLVLGPRRSEEPYSREDKDLLASLAATLAMVLDRPAPGPAGESFGECAACGSCCGAEERRCPRDGSPLTAVAVPRLLAGRYYLQHRIGRGGMGTVYAASDAGLRRQVAVKLIREELVGSADAAERFRREAQASAGFAHPNVVTVHDFGVATGTRAFLVMELLEGESLRQRLRQRGCLDTAAVLDVMRGVTAALDVAHRQDLIHRDLKPENIFLARVGEGEAAKILDFGLAKFRQRSGDSMIETASGVVVGTARYLSPEVLRGGAADVTADLWALAVTVYEALTGEYPFAGATVAECHRHVLAGEFTAVRRYWPEASPSLQQLFAAVFAADVGGRPKSAKSFFAELERALGAARVKVAGSNSA